MNVLIAGMPRTASTAIFNIVRFIFEEKEMEYYSCLKYDKSKEKENNVLKIHQYSPKFEKWFDIIILPIRDIRDVVCSYNNHRGIIVV